MFECIQSSSSAVAALHFQADVPSESYNYKEHKESQVW